MERFIKIMLMFSVAVWGFTGFLSNMVDFGPGLEQVRSVLTMDGAPDTPGRAWRQINSPLFAVIGFASIYLTKLLIGLLSLYCSVQLFLARKADAVSFDAAKKYGVLACGIGMVVFFFCFIALVENYFEYWRVPIFGLATHDFAFSYIMYFLGFIFFLKSPENELK